MKEFLYVIGEPGSGKSTVVASMVGDTEASVVGIRKPGAVKGTVAFSITVYSTQSEYVAEIGYRRDNFPGTDALAMNVQPAVQAWLLDMDHGLVFAEGDRLANAKFFDFLIEHGWNLVIARLRVRRETAASRRGERDTRQDESWVESRRTKVDRLGAMYPERTLNLWNEDGDTEAVIDRLAHRSPVAAAFR